MATKRILFVIMDLGGGAGVYCRILAKGLRREFPGEFDLSLIVLRDRGFLAGDNEVFDQIQILPSRNRLGQIMEMKRGIAAAEPECIICIGTFANLMVPMLAGRRRTMLTILTVHGNYTRLLGESRWPWILRPLLRRRFARNLVVAPAQGVADDLIANFSAQDVRVIPHGIDVEEVAKLASESVSDLPVEPYMIAVGRLAIQKDYPTMLRAYAQARGAGLKMPLVIVGDGPELEAMRGLAGQLGIAEHVRFLGHRDNPFPYMKHAQFLVLSSEWEGFGLVLIEAMSLGVPCISTDCPSGPGEIFAGGEYGMLLPVGDVNELAEAMLRMQKPEVREWYSQLAKERSENFTIHQMASAYVELLANSATVQ